MSCIAVQRDHDSFLRIYDHFMPRLCMYLKRLGCTPAVAEELSQDALLKLWQRAELYDPSRSQLSTWLFRIARNCYIDQVRKEPHWVDMQDALDQVGAHVDSGAPTSAEEQAEQGELHRYIQSLRDTQARLIHMAYFQFKTHQQIAAELDLPLGTVKSGLRRALIKLQIRMKSTS